MESSDNVEFCAHENNHSGQTWISVHVSPLSESTCKLLNRLGTERYARWCGRGTNHPPIRYQWSSHDILHNEDRIRRAEGREEIYFAVVQGEIVGTGSIRGNEICRLFILPEYQAKGYGSRLMDLLEDIVFRQYRVIHIDASFPAERMYLKRGYRIKTYEMIETEGGDYLCYHTMEKARVPSLGGSTLLSAD